MKKIEARKISRYLEDRKTKIARKARKRKEKEKEITARENNKKVLGETVKDTAVSMYVGICVCIHVCSLCVCVCA